MCCRAVFFHWAEWTTIERQQSKWQSEVIYLRESLQALRRVVSESLKAPLHDAVETLKQFMHRECPVGSKAPADRLISEEKQQNHKVESNDRRDVVIQSLSLSLSKLRDDYGELKQHMEKAHKQSSTLVEETASSVQGVIEKVRSDSSVILHFPWLFP